MACTSRLGTKECIELDRELTTTSLLSGNRPRGRSSSRARLLAEKKKRLTNRHESKAPPPNQLLTSGRRSVGVLCRGTSAHSARSRRLFGCQRTNSISLG